MTPTPNELVERLEALARDFEPRPDNAPVQGGRIARLAREAIEALTSQQHTEPVAGEVEVAAWLVKGDPELGDYLTKSREAAERSDLGHEPLVTKSSYDALAAAKDAEIAELDFLLHEGGTWEEMLSKAERERDEAMRQRDALREALLSAKNAANSFRDESGDAVADQVIVRIDAALKDEGSAP